MLKVDNTVKNYTVQMPVYLWEFLNKRAKELNYMPSTYLSSIVFGEMQNPAAPIDIHHLMLKERLYPVFEEEHTQEVIDIINNESRQIYDLMLEAEDFDTSHEE